MANYNIAISVDTSGAIQALNTLKTSLDETQKSLDKAKDGADDTGKAMGNAFGDVAQQLQNFDQGITRIVENFLKLKGVADELLNKSLEQFKKNEQERLSLDVVLNTQGAFGDIEKFKSKILPILSNDVMLDFSKNKSLLDSDPIKYGKQFDAFAKSILYLGSTMDDIKQFREDTKDLSGQNLRNYLEKTLIKTQQSKIEMARKADSEIQRLYKTTKFSQGQITDMFTDMISKGVDPKTLTDAIVNESNGTKVTMLDKIVQLGASFTKDLGGADKALLEAGQLVHQILNVASPGYETDFASNVQHLGKYMDQMITAMNLTPLKITNIGDVLVRNMGFNQKYYTTTFSEFLALAGKLLVAKSGPEAGEYIHAFQRGFIMIQQGIDRQSADKRQEMQRTNKSGGLSQPATRATAKSLATVNLQNEDMLKLTENAGFKTLLNQMILDKATNEKLVQLSSTGQFNQIPALLQEFAKTKGVTIEEGLMNSMRTVMTGLYDEMNNLTKGTQSFTDVIGDDLISREVMVKNINGTYTLLNDIAKTDYNEKTGNYQGDILYKKGHTFSVGDQIPIINRSVNDDLMMGKYADNSVKLLQKKVDELGSQSFAYNLLGNDLLLSFYNLANLGGNLEQLISGIQNSVFTLDESYKQFEQTLSNAVEINEGLMDGMFRAFSNNVGFVNLSFEKLKTTLMSSYLGINEETRKVSDGATSNVLLLLSTIGKVGAIIGSALALSASYSLIVPYLTMDALGQKVGMLSNLKTRLIDMIPFLKYISIGAIVLVGLGVALQKVFGNGATLGEMFKDIGDVFNKYLVPAFVDGKVRIEGVSKPLVMLQKSVIAIRSVLIGFIDGFSDILAGAISVATKFFIITGAIVGVLFGASTGYDTVTQYIGYLGYALGIILPIMWTFNAITAISNLLFSSITKRILLYVAVAFLLIGVFKLINEYGIFASLAITAIGLAMWRLVPASWSAIAPFLKMMGILLLIVGVVGLLIEGFLMLGKAMGSETAVAWDKKYQETKDQLAEKAKKTMEFTAMPDISNLTKDMPVGITPDQLTSQSLPVPSGSEMIDLKSLPQIQTQSAPITVNVTLKEAIIEPTSDVFLKRVANTLVPHIQDALNRNNVVMG
jgi:hypothetical protein